MNRAGITLILGLLLGLGCASQDGIVEPPAGQMGQVSLWFPQAPAQIVSVVATLSRQGFSDLTATLVVVDSTQGASGSFADVPVGLWHLKVEALDTASVVRFRGETDVEVIGGHTSEVDLELLPTSGSINIRVRWGNSNLLVNGSFEDGPYPGTGGWLLVAGSTEITGWVVTPVTINYVGVAWTAADGLRSVDLDGDNPGGIQQGFTTTPGRNYIVRFQMAGNPDPNPATRIKAMRILAAGQHADFSFDTNGRTPQDMGWTTHTWSFTADSTTTVLAFRSLSSDPNSQRGPVLDNVVVQTTSLFSPFNEEFDGPALDLSKWLLVAGNGSVTLSGGKLTLSCQDGGIFPYIVPKSNSIPLQGDFVVRVGMRYLSAASAGTGFVGFVDDPAQAFGFGYWQDTCCGGHLAFVGDSLVTLSHSADTSYHTYEWRSVQGVYSFFFDGQLIGSQSGSVRPTTFFFGHRPVISLPSWSSQEVDYVRVEPLGGPTP